MYWKDRQWTRSHKLLEQIENFLSSTNYYVRAEDGRIHAKGGAQPHQSPWSFINDCPTRHCDLWNHVYFQVFGIIPMACRFSCWKVVMKPSTVKELFALEQMLKKYEYSSKCGIDVRTYTDWPYAGFIYTSSMEQGRRVLAQMRQDIEWSFPAGHGVTAFLKRGCTEMEWNCPSDQWDGVSEETIEKEQQLNEIFVKDQQSARQSDVVKQMVRARWISHAISIGDLTWKEMVDDPSDYLPHTVKYDTDELKERTASWI